MKDDYKRLSREWGSLARKQQGRARKSRLRRITEEELEPVDPELPERIKKLVGDAEPDLDTALPRKKNTRKWCKGKVGRLHKPVCKKWDEVKSVTPQDILSLMRSRWRNNYRVLVCERCGKELAYWYGGKGKNRPDWVDR